MHMYGLIYIFLIIWQKLNFKIDIFKSRYNFNKNLIFHATYLLLDIIFSREKL